MSVSNLSVAVVGLGYIGLPTAAVIAGSGSKVVGVDVQQSVVDCINAGRIHIEEPDLDNLVQAAVASGLLSASLEVPEADVFIIAVPTPSDETHRPEMAFVFDAARSIARMLRPGNLVILESTSPIGTTEQMSNIIAECRPDLRLPHQGESDGPADVCIAYCPERVLPGRILMELIANDRCVGGITQNCAKKAAAFYKRFVAGDCIPITAREAEMVKLAENSFRDVNIAFANELSLIADRMSINVWDVIRISNRHPRVNILQPGPGVGGHCIAVDPWFLVHSAPEQTKLIRTARDVNDGKSEYVIRKAKAMIDASPNLKVACLGLAFKPDVDDFRESPSLRIASVLAADYGSRIFVVEPFARSLPEQFISTGSQLVGLVEALENCGIILLLVDHSAFRAIEPAMLTGKHVYDTRGCLPVGI